jgi:hypothetical protein
VASNIRRLAPVAAACLYAGLVPSAEAGRAHPQAAALRPTAERAYTARVVAPTRVRPRPTPKAQPSERLGTRAIRGGGPMRLLVLDSTLNDGGRL